MAPRPYRLRVRPRPNTNNHRRLAYCRRSSTKRPATPTHTSSTEANGPRFSYTACEHKRSCRGLLLVPAACRSLLHVPQAHTFLAFTRTGVPRAHASQPRTTAPHHHSPTHVRHSPTTASPCIWAKRHHTHAAAVPMPPAGRHSRGPRAAPFPAVQHLPARRMPVVHHLQSTFRRAPPPPPGPALLHPSPLTLHLRRSQQPGERPRVITKHVTLL